MESLKRWETPEYYGGFDPVGDYVLIEKTRDSNALERSNFECFEKIMDEAEDKLDLPEEFNEGECCVYTWRADHWACGWVDYLMLAACSPDSLINEATEVTNALADYPCINEGHYCQLEHDEVQAYWASLSIDERMHYIKRENGNIFAARHNELTENADPNGSIFYTLSEG